ncbi:MAG: hypothetical protein RLZZ450_5054 [Pseudomonadota bacterium]
MSVICSLDGGSSLARPRARFDRASLTVCARLGLLVCLWVSAGCESLIDLKDRHYEPGGTDGGPGPGPVPGPTPTDQECDEYCGIMLGSDGGVGSCSAVYPSIGACKAVCKVMAHGDLKEDQRDPSVFNTFACRRYYATLAQTDPKQCLAAGPGGQGGCGSNCESYCALFAASGCSDDALVKTLAQPIDVASCKTKCELGLRDNLTLDSANGKDHEGNTVQCRLVHISNAISYKTTAPASFATHCGHAAFHPKDLCVDELAKPASDVYCADYCSLVKNACTSQQKLYESDAQCMAVCKATDPGTDANSSSGNTMTCRLYHGFNSLLVADSHCGHAGAGGWDAPHCGDECASYCHLAAGACGAAFTQKYPGADPEAACRTACAGLPTMQPMGYGGYTVAAGVAAVNAGDSLQCRLYHAIKAVETPTGNAASCTSALGAGSCAAR